MIINKSAFCCKIVALILTLVLSLSTYASSSTQPKENYQLYTANGEYYLKSQPTWVPIGSEVFVIIPIYEAKDLLKLSKVNGQWQVVPITKAQFDNVNPQLVSDSSIQYVDSNGDGLTDIKLLLSGNGLEQISLINSSNSFSVSTIATGVDIPQAPTIASAPSLSKESIETGAINSNISVDPSGAAIWSSQLTLPQGINNFQPNVSVSYSSFAGNSVLGVGWQLGVGGSIERCRKNYEEDSIYQEVKFTNADQLCFNGQRLILASGNHFVHGASYRPKMDPTTKVNFYGNETSGYFVVQKPNGESWTFGQAANAKVSDLTSSKNYRWLLQQKTDSYNNSINYQYIGSDSQTKRVEKITYSGNSIEFQYLERTDGGKRYYQGNGITDTKLLTDITIKNHNNVAINSYHFNHKYSAFSSRALLTDITQCDGSKTGYCLQPTSFQYDDQMAMGLVPESEELAFSISEILGNGSGAANSAGDICDSLTRPNTYCSSQAMALGDTNGDGITEVVILSGGESGSDRPYKAQAITITSDGYIKNGASKQGQLFKQPLSELHGSTRVRYDFYGAGLTVGDTDGDGSDEIIITKDFPGSESPGTPYLDMNGDGLIAQPASVDLSGFSYNLYDKVERYTDCLNAPGLSPEETQSTSALSDLNGDGLVDRLLTLSGTCFDEDSSFPLGEYYYVLENTSQGSVLSEKVSDISTDDIVNVKHTGDINGDGFTDFYPYGCMTGTGVATDCFQEHGLATSYARRFFTDINADGKDDLIELGTNTGIVAQFSKLNSASAPSSTLGSVSWNKIPKDTLSLIWADIDGDGLPALIYFDKGTRQLRIRHDANTENRKVDILTSVNNGMKATTELEYQPLTNSNIYTKYTGAENLNYGNGSPVIDKTLKQHVVKSIKQSKATDSDGNILIADKEYKYEGLRVQSGGRGSLGFAKVIELDHALNTRTTTSYRQDYPFNGKAVAQTKEILISPNLYGTTYEMTISQWRHLKFLNNKVHQIVPGKKTEKHYTFSGSDGDLINSRTLFNTKTTESTLTAQSGNYGVITTSKVSTLDPNSVQTQVTTVANQYNQEDTSNWYISRPTATTKTVQLHNAGIIEQRTTRQATSYNSNNKVDYTEVGTLPVDGNATDASQYLKTAYLYDLKGNTTSVTRCSYHYATSCATRAVPNDTDNNLYKVFDRQTTQYDASYRYPTSTSNALHRTATFSNYNALGLAQTITNAVGANQYLRYDSFGRQYFIASDDGSYSSTTLSTCESWSGCPTGAVFAQTVSSPNVPASKTYYGVAGKVIASRTQLIDGTWAQTKQGYNLRGEMDYQSTPYLTTATPAAASYYYFDNMGRKWKEVGADGTVKQMSWSGLTETIAVSSIHSKTYSAAVINQTSYKTINGFGQLITSRDANLQNTSYQYNALGSLSRATNMDGSSISISYDDYGRKTQLNDPDKGIITYKYNALGAMVGRVSPANDQENSYFDAALRKVKAETISSSGNAIGSFTYTGALLASEVASEGITKTYTYDNLGRSSQVQYQVDNNTWTTSTTYDQYGRVFQEFDASGSSRGTQYRYSNGYNIALAEASNNQLTYYQVLAQDARGNITQWQLANGHQGSAQYDVYTGHLSALQAAYNGLAIQNQAYEYDGIGNLRARVDLTGDGNHSQLKETFDYDQLNRLTKVTFQDITSLAVTYNANGNINTKSDVASGASYAYGSRASQCAATPGIHALTAIGSRYTYCYDNKGNQTASYDGGVRQRSVTYSGYDKPLTINSNNGNSVFSYDANHQRFKRTDSDNLGNRTTYYLGNVELVSHANGLQEYKRYIGSHVIDTVRSNGNNNTYYLHKDHLGSINFISNKTGSLLHKLSFDAFGKRRQGTSWSALQQVFTTPSIASVLQITEKGFTGHEHVDHADIIHMGGRIYDPIVGRFVQADPIIQAPENGQSFNRYSYVFNNPLSYTDPTGYTAENSTCDQRGGSSACEGNVADSQREAMAKTENSTKEAKEKAANIISDKTNVSNGAFSESGSSGFWDSVQLTLDAVGMVPFIGEVADLANVGISLGRGDYEGAALSAAAMVPFVGNAATVVKLANKAEKLGDATKAINPKDINFSQSSINRKFDTPEGKVNIQTAMREGAEQVSDFPPIKVQIRKGQMVVRDGNSRLTVARKTKAKSINVVIESDVDSFKDLNSRLKSNGLGNQGTKKLPRY